MAENKHLLVLRLEGVLQAWGDDSKWDFRDSAALPSKSGIVGLIACAMGLEREDSRIVSLSQSITVAVRADRAGTKFTDFQTVTGKPLMAAGGKPKSTGNTIISPRVYLQDSCFTVFIDTEDTLRKSIIAALKQPKWCMYLGRKSCVPSRPVLECECAEYSSLAEAVKRYPLADRSGRPVIYETEITDNETVSRFRADARCGAREFTMRRVWYGAVKEAGNVSDKS